jgi:hypothetical protein
MMLSSDQKVSDSMETRPNTAFALLFVPVLVLNVLRFAIAPIDAMFSFSTELMLICNGIAIAFGFFLYKRTQMVRDHEWQRTKALKATKKQFKAEESGVWEREVDHGIDDSNISKEALEGTASRFNLEIKEIELDRDETTEVQFLMDSEAVINATRRVTGKDNFDEKQIQSTVGATRKTGFMDRLIDSVMDLFGKDSPRSRQAKHADILTQRAINEPIIAQKPIAPVLSIEGDAPVENLEIMSLSDHGDVVQELNPSSPMMADEQKLIHTSPQSGVVNSPPAAPSHQQVTQAVSFEQMAMISSTPTSSQRVGQSSVSGPCCPECGASREPTSRFCDSCGAE